MEKLIIIALIFVLSTITTGVYYMYKGTTTNQRKLRMFLRFLMVFFLPLLFMTVFTLVPGFVSAQTEGGSSQGLGFIAAGLSTGLASLGAGLAVANVGSSAIGAVSEDPKILGKTMIFLGLSEGIAIYGLIISIMILGRL